MLPRLKFYLRKNSTTYYKSNAPYRTVSTTSADDKQPIIDPANWGDMPLNIKRDLFDYDGLVINYAEKLRFVLDGRRIIDHVLNNEHIEGDLQLHIMKLDSSTMSYKDFYIGDVDLSQADIQRDYADVTVLQGGASKKIKANENITYELPIIDSTRVGAKLDGIELFNTYKWASPTMDTVSFDYNGFAGDRYLFPLGFIKTTSEYFNGYIYPRTQGYEIITSGNTPQDEKEFLNSNITLTDAVLTITGEVFLSNVQITNHQTRGLLIKKDTSNNSQSIEWVFFDEQVAEGQSPTFNFTVSTTITLFPQPNKYFLVFEALGTRNNSSAKSDIRVIDLDFKMEVVERLPSSTGYGYRVPTIFDMLGARVLGSTGLTQSSYLNNQLPPTATQYDSTPYRELITSGLGIRGRSDISIKTSLADFKKDLFVRHCVSMGVENETLIAEHLSHFYDKDKLLYDFGTDIADLRIKPLIEYLGSSIKSGYPDRETQDNNGLEEFNSEYEHKPPTNRITTPIDHTTRYRADPYGVEFIRVNLTDDTYRDNETDNDVFILSLSSTIDGTTGAYELNRTGAPYTGFTVANSSIFNMPLSNGRNLRRCKPLFGSLYYSTNNKTFNFISTKKNKSVFSSISTPINEDGNIDMSIPVAQLIFKPYVFTFDAPPPSNLMELMNGANKYGYVKFTYKGTEYKGFFLETGTNTAKDSKFTHILLAHPDSPTSYA